MGAWRKLFGKPSEAEMDASEAKATAEAAAARDARAAQR